MAKFKPARTLIRHLEKIRDHILEQPNRFAMGVFWRQEKAGEVLRNPSIEWSSNRFEAGQTFPECGTICCIAGWSRVFGGGSIKGINSAIVVLADVHEWPKPFRDQYPLAKKPKERAQIAAARIDHYIKTGA